MKSIAEQVRFRVNPELEDILDWLEIDAVDSEYARQQRVLETLLCQRRQLLRLLFRFRRVQRQSRKLRSPVLSLRRRKQQLQALLSPECGLSVELEAQRLRELVRSLPLGQRREWPQLLGIGRQELEQGCARRGTLRVEVAGLLAWREGSDFVAALAPASLRLCGRYTLTELEERIAEVMATG